MGVFDQLAGALLHVGGGDDAEIDFERHAQALDAAVGGAHDERADTVGGLLREVSARQLGAPAGAERRHQAAEEFVAAAIAAGGGKDRLDVLDLAANAEPGGDLESEPEAVRIGIALRHLQREYAIRPERAGAQRRRDAAVDAAGETDHESALAQPPRHPPLYRGPDT